MMEVYIYMCNVCGLVSCFWLSGTYEMRPDVEIARDLQITQQSEASLAPELADAAPHPPSGVLQTNKG